MRLSKPILTGLVFATLVAATPGAYAQDEDAMAIRQAAFEAGDVEAGENVFKKCRACHKIGEGAKNGVGPMLTDFIGVEVASVEGFKYSKAFMEKKEEGLVWTVEALDAYLLKPRDFVPKTKMTFAGLKKEEDRANVIAYLASLELGDE